MPNELLYMMEDLLEGGIVFSSVGPSLSLIAYVFTALSLYTIAQRREIRKPWLAWIPVVNVWILGSLSDQYRYVVKGEIKSKRKILLGLSLVNLLMGIVLTVYMAVLAVQAMQMAFHGPVNEAMGMDMMQKGFTLVLMAAPMLVISLVSLVLRYLALYDIYTSCDPANNMIYLILSIVPVVNQVTQPLFLFLCRNQDGGMPPRKPQPENFESSADL